MRNLSLSMILCLVSRSTRVLAFSVSPSKVSAKRKNVSRSALHLEPNLANNAADLAVVGDSVRALVTSMAKQGGPPAMAAAVAVSDSVPLLPTQPISVVAGALFGFQTGLLAVVLGQTIATTFALIVGRKLGSNILDILGENSVKVERVLEQLGLDAAADFKQVLSTILVARQSPVLPFSLGNYMIGAATSAPLVPVVLGTVLGCMPLNCLWVGAGAGGMSALDAISNGNNGIGLGGLEAVGAVATVVVLGNIVKVVWSVWNEEDAQPIIETDEDGVSPIQRVASLELEEEVGDSAMEQERRVKATV